jgi:hypothetical protein
MRRLYDSERHEPSNLAGVYRLLRKRQANLAITIAAKRTKNPILIFLLLCLRKFRIAASINLAATSKFSFQFRLEGPLIFGISNPSIFLGQPTDLCSR